MIYPSADTIEHQMDSKYSLVVIAAKRAKQIKEGAPILIDTDSTNALTIAMEEIAAGKVTISPSSIMAAAPPETAAQANSPTRDPLLTEAQAGPLLTNGLDADAGTGADDAPGAAALEMDDPETERLAAANDTDDAEA